MYTKKMMAQQFGVCQRTVIRTLIACNVPTNRQRHTAQEYQDYCKARRLFELGLCTEQIRKYFQLRQVTGEEIINVLKEDVSC